MTVEKYRLCREIVEALARSHPYCPLLRHCDIFRSTCNVPNRIDLTEPDTPCADDDTWGCKDCGKK